ncbi:MAG: helix-turn-helix domain-containing protein [Pseudomonadota bacterium]
MSAIAPHKEDIKAALRKRHGSIRKFEERAGLPVGSVRDVLRGRASERTARAIACDLGMSTDILFPGRFKSHIADDSAISVAAHRLNGLGR